MKVIHADRLVSEIRRLARANPSHVAGGSYFEDNTGAPNCIVGSALACLGVTKQDLNHGNGIAFASLVDYSVNYGILFSGMTEEIKEWIIEVQDLQDDELPWGDVIAVAGDYLPT